MKDLTKGNEIKHILIFAIPLLIGNVFQQFYNMVDTIIVGQYLGSNALAAVGTSTPVFNLIISFAMGLSIGGGVVISHYYGAKKYEELKRSVSTFLISMFVFSIVLTIIGLIVCRPLLTLLKTPESIMENAVAYLNILIIGLAFTFLYNVFSGILRGLGDSWSPLIFLIISSLLNVVLDILFVGPLNMGVGGAAWATVIAQGISLLLCIIYVNRRIPLLRYTRKEFVFIKDEFITLFSYGINTGAQQTVLAVGNLLIQGLVNSFGEVTMAAFTAAIKADQIAVMPVLSIGMAVTSFTSQNVGARKYKRVKKGFISSLLIAVVTSIVFAIVMSLIGENLIGIFLKKDDINYAQIVLQGKEYLLTVSLFYWLVGSMFIINGVLRGAGDMLIPTLSTTISLTVRVLAAYALGPVINYKAIWYAIPIGWAFGLILPLIRYISDRWMDKAKMTESLNHN